MIRHICRALMAGAFIYSGVEALRRPASRPEDAAAIPGVDPADSAQIVTASGAVQIVGGGLLLWDKMPRTTATVLAGSLVPTTLVDHAFWAAPEDQRKDQLLHFLKNAALFGGLVITAMDTQGKPGIGWRATHAVDHAGAIADYKRREAELLAQLARQKALTAAAEGRAKAIDVKSDVRAKVADVKADHIAPAARAVKDAKIGLSVAGRTGRTLAKGAARTGSVVVRGGKALASTLIPG